jgi:glucose dehydrogenase
MRFHQFSNTLLWGSFFWFAACKSRKQDPYSGWPVTGGNSGHLHYSSLTEVDTTSVRGLKPVWTYHTGDADALNNSQIQCNPIIVNGVLYGTTPRLALFALDAETGGEKWKFNPMDSNWNRSAMDFILNNNRGVSFWEDGETGVFFIRPARSFMRWTPIRVS